MGATVVMVCRDRGRGEAAQAEIKLQTRNDDVHLLLADLASQQSIRQLAEEVHARFQRLDVLINNAGVFLARRSETVDGFEMTFAVNHLAYFLLTNLLLDLLQASAPARIVNVSSAAHRGGRINFDDLQASHRYWGWGAYCQSKLANVLFTYELARRLQGTGVTANCLHPGTVSTNLFQGLPGILSLGAVVARTFLLSPEKGAETMVYLASSPEVVGISGRYFVKRRAVASSRASHDEAAQRKLWEVSAQLTKL